MPNFREGGVTKKATKVGDAYIAHAILTGVPASEAITIRRDYDAANQPTYTGYALSVQENPPALAVVVTAGNPTVSASVSHGLATGQLVRVAGATGPWAALNGDRAVTVAGVNAFTLAVNSVGFAGAFDGVVTVLAPRQIDAVWAIGLQTWVANLLVLEEMCNGNGQMTNVWANRATLAYQ